MEEYFVEIGGDAMLVLLEDLHVLELVFFHGFEDVAVVPHEAGLDLFEVLLEDNFLESHQRIKEENVFRRSELVWV